MVEVLLSTIRPRELLAGKVIGLGLLGFGQLLLAAAALLIPLAARIYSGAVLRTGSAIKLRDAWRASRAGA